MAQETGETRDAIIEDDNKRIQEIVAANRSRTEKYWIVVFAKPSKHHVEGKPVLVKHIKAYGVKPMAQVGMIVGEVDNSTGEISWEVNMPDRPFDESKLLLLGGKPCDEIVRDTTSIAHAYVTQ
jgi:hypothetical protein